MPTKKPKRVRKVQALETRMNQMPMMNAPSSSKPSFFNSPTKLYLVVLALIILAFVLLNKSWFIAAMVNGKPIWRWNLNKAMTARYGKQTLESMLSEKLISDAANKSGVMVTLADIKKQEDDVVKSLGDKISLDDLLKYQGVTKTDFENQIKVRLLVQKTLGKDIQITETDIDNFIASNRAQLVATDPAKLREEARQALMESKIGEKFQTWFNDLKQKASILRFL